MNILEINNLSFSYDHYSENILDDINLHIKLGSYVSVIGANGSAKSTLMKLILNLLKPCTGSINLSTNKIGYVPQRLESFNAQFPITVYEILRCHMRALKLKDKSLLKEVMEFTNIESFENKLIGNLSGGQQQKVFIARALLGSPELLVLDEPSTGIDAKSQEEIYSLIKHLNTHEQISVLSVEHNIKTALDYSTHILKLENAGARLFTVKDFTKENKEVLKYAAL